MPSFPTIMRHHIVHVVLIYNNISVNLISSLPIIVRYYFCTVFICTGLYDKV